MLENFIGIKFVKKNIKEKIMQGMPAWKSKNHVKRKLGGLSIMVRMGLAMQR